MLRAHRPTGHHVGIGAEDAFAVEVDQVVQCVGGPDFSFPEDVREKAPLYARLVIDSRIFKEQFLWRRSAADWLTGGERVDVIVDVTCD